MTRPKSKCFSSVVREHYCLFGSCSVKIARKPMKIAEMGHDVTVMLKMTIQNRNWRGRDILTYCSEGKVPARGTANLNPRRMLLANFHINVSFSVAKHFIWGVCSKKCTEMLAHS